MDPKSQNLMLPRQIRQLIIELKRNTPLVVHHKAAEDNIVHRREQICFYNKDLDMGKVLAPGTTYSRR